MNERDENVLLDAVRRAPGPMPGAAMTAAIRARAGAVARRRSPPVWLNIAAGVVVLVGAASWLRVADRVPEPLAPRASTPVTATDGALPDAQATAPEMDDVPAFEASRSAAASEPPIEQPLADAGPGQINKAEARSESQRPVVAVDDLASARRAPAGDADSLVAQGLRSDAPREAAAGAKLEAVPPSVSSAIQTPALETAQAPMSVDAPPLTESPVPAAPPAPPAPPVSFAPREPVGRMSAAPAAPASVSPLPSIAAEPVADSIAPAAAVASSVPAGSSTIGLGLDEAQSVVALERMREAARDRTKAAHDPRFDALREALAAEQSARVDALIAELKRDVLRESWPADLADRYWPE